MKTTKGIYQATCRRWRPPPTRRHPLTPPKEALPQPPPKETADAATMGMQRPCPNKASGCDWWSPDNEGITAEEEAQHLTVCSTNPTVIKGRKERKNKVQRRRQLEQEELGWLPEQPPYTPITMLNAPGDLPKQEATKEATKHKATRQHQHDTRHRRSRKQKSTRKSSPRGNSRWRSTKQRHRKSPRTTWRAVPRQCQCHQSKKYPLI